MSLLTSQTRGNEISTVTAIPYKSLFQTSEHPIVNLNVLPHVQSKSCITIH